MKDNGYILLTGSSNPKLATQIAHYLHVPIFASTAKFSDGETRVKIPINLRKREVFIIQPTCPPNVDSDFIELILMIDAAKRASASRITAVIPYFGYARQDRKETSRVPISSALLNGIIEFAGADSICSIDLHSEPQQGFVRIPHDNIFGSYSLIPAIKALKIKNLVVASPDKGGVIRATAYGNRLGANGLAIVYKERDLSVQNTSEALDMIGDVKGKTVLLVDDMIDTAGTLCNAAKMIQSRGATKIYAAATHGIFSGPALERITNSPIEKVLVTDTIPQDGDRRNPKIKVISVAPLLAEAIRRIYTGESISEKLIIN